MVWWMVYQGYTMAQASALTWVVALASGDPGRLARDLWMVLEDVDPEVSFIFYITWWFMTLKLIHDRLAVKLAVGV